MQHLPIFFDIKQQLCVVIGGGEIATRKVTLLLRTGAKVRVIAPEMCHSLSTLQANGKIEHLARQYQEGDLDGAVLAIAATDVAQTNRLVAAAARASRIPVNVVDNPDEGNFIMPSIIDRSPVVAAVSTGGASPVLARLIRTRLESLIPAGYGRLAELAGKFRKKAKQAFSDPADRRRFWDCILQGGVAERVFSGHMEEAELMMEKELQKTSSLSGMGEVYLVGAGPGDPDLLTFRALRLM